MFHIYMGLSVTVRLVHYRGFSSIITYSINHPANLIGGISHSIKASVRRVSSPSLITCKSYIKLLGVLGLGLINDDVNLHTDLDISTTTTPIYSTSR